MCVYIYIGPSKPYSSNGCLTQTMNLYVLLYNQKLLLAEFNNSLYVCVYIYIYVLVSLASLSLNISTSRIRELPASPPRLGAGWAPIRKTRELASCWRTFTSAWNEATSKSTTGELASCWRIVCFSVERSNVEINDRRACRLLIYIYIYIERERSYHIHTYV